MTTRSRSAPAEPRATSRIWSSSSSTARAHSPPRSPGHAKNETVNFRIGSNEGASGQYTYADKVVTVPGRPWQTVKPTYSNGHGDNAYDVRFDGKARAGGAAGYGLTGTLSGHSDYGTLTEQSCTFAYETDSGNRQYKT